MRVEELLRLATRRGVHVCLRPRVGEYVAAGTTLAWVWPPSSSTSDADADALARRLDALVRIGFERTLEQDPSFGMRQLVDAACKALSPAINDPYTAVQAIHHLSVVYTELAKRRVGTVVIDGPTGASSVVIPARTLADHLDVGMGLIRRTEPPSPPSCTPCWSL